MLRNKTLLFATLLVALFSCGSLIASTALGKKKIKVLIVDGQNNHENWPATTSIMKQYLEETELFEVTVSRTAFTWKGDDLIPKYPIVGLPATTPVEKPVTDPEFKPDFSNYDVVISNFGWNAASWPLETQQALEAFVAKGGGLVVVHAADNSFPEWVEYNKMIGLGGWGGRTEKDGPYVYYNNDGKLIRDTQAGNGGAHGPQSEYQIQIRNSDHPITKDMPPLWMHAKDELYNKLRGPAENMDVLATAYSDENNKGTGRHEPILIALTYGKGKIFHTPMGHANYSVACVGYITSLLRGTQWAATGKVTIPIPEDFPTAEVSSSREVR